MKHKHLLWMGLTCLALTGHAQAQTSYQSHEQRSSRLRTLASANGSLASVKSIGKSRGQRDIWLLTLSKGDAAKKPALLIVAGLEGAHLAGTETAIQMAEKMLANAGKDSIAKLLETKAIYIIPSANPDAQEQWAAKPRYARSENGLDYDNDRDGRLNEDPFEDLNGDGLITMVRVEDPTGTFIVSKDDPRVLVKADPAKGESGKYILITEGTDNDKDGKFNEDGAGGVHIDKNFTFDYPIFVDGSGDYAASEPEVRAISDFLYGSPNIFAVLTFGPNNNLSEAPKFDQSKVARRIVTGPTQKDASAMEQVSKLYNSLGLKDAPAMPQTKGNFSQTAYFHAGRFSFTTPGWWAPKVEAAKDTTKKADAGAGAATTAPAGGGRMGGGGAGAAAAGADNDDVRFLKWADREKLTDVFVEWKEIKHPDFPDKKAEVGGIAPYAKLNPPVNYLNETAEKHLKFIAGLGMQMPDVQIVNVRTESLGNGLNRITLQVVNKGLLPTYADMGDRVRWVKKVKTELFLGNGQSIVSGRKIILRNALAAGEAEEYTWLISGTGKLTIQAGCPTAGVASTEVTLK
ncbi:M14 family metallopeptidase [Rhodoflexus caldus]|uniref:M14 family metallopeptidase n=1 Tax=Rhodoflexus caldus TaxID=2891236 RepID=UPI00202A26CD|nr:M14 family metallopeptidase [Rhodoflexus caldus]